MSGASAGHNIAHDLVRRADEDPGRTALWFEDGRSWTYAELRDAAARVAAGLQAAGIAPGRRLGIFLPNGPELVLALYGSWLAGVVPVAVSALYTPEELVGSVAKVDPDLVLVPGPGDAADALRADGRRLAALGGVAGSDSGSAPPGADVVRLDADPDGPTVPHAVTPDDEGAVLFTGGTTGTAKAVSLTHGGVRKSLSDLALAMKGGQPGPYPLVDATPNLLLLPLFHSGGQAAFLFAFHVGRSAVLVSRFRVETLVRLVGEHRIDNLFLLPTMVYDLAYAEGEIELSSVKSILVSGQALDPIVRRDFEQRFEVPILSNYGATELGHVAGWMGKDLREDRWKPGAAGRIYDTAEVEIRSEDGTVLGTGEVGEICVRTGITKGYVDQGGDGASMLVDEQGWVSSGDMGHVDEDGVLFLSGRKRDLIKTGGFQIWPAELETALREHAAVRDAAVVGAPDARLGEIPRAYVVLAEGVDQDGAADVLIAHVRDRLAHFKAVREVVFLDALPRTDAGKVDRGALMRQVGG
ncbi:MAG: acyl--CoA ligase [Patulibacter sp.]|nr:acyl--CoA ligase [Patulibacter sp.]